uniref:Uncharacterized protein n=1 Tax=Grammatophora oceanica TaxID=210454 RepID=A0A7S1UPU4_9STRA|mmetsp:Transcript_12428/g.18276  ORF Transcript_12428/g.18276 Transcript_12428/m.18276 type:complete len:180 (+) Transcript_12428:87-626(+)|eukprot:CAMPEP_0194062132 /NCGR_PEP_ID=MMETSP0009_2-20130614/76604_1 /TAXON_ID=210454 /ORGANISM="Grammatophora oceanica, Strain CCMP 410" /LENGTH=179 /DNA_ID=CAMNT_0038713747 /DNA_START=75 /DNA_END=614 /DNA_ORIENTATION=-
MCVWWLCYPPWSKKNNNNETKEEAGKEGALMPVDPQDVQDYEDLEYIARKREIKVTIRKGTQAGVAAGLSVMAGVIVAGPVGAVVGGAVGTAMAASIAKNVVPLNQLLEETPPHKRKEILKCFHESFKEEFVDTIQGSPELKLLMGGTSIFGVVRYMVDREMIQSEQLERLDGILKHIA